MDKSEEKCFSNTGSSQRTWDKELYIRYHTKGRFAFEVSAGHYAFREIQTGSIFDCIIDPVENISYSVVRNVYERSQHMEWNISAQYDISCPALQEKCPLFKNLKSYVGVMLTPTLNRVTTSTEYFKDGGTLRADDARDNWNIWTGLNHTLIYNLCDRMYISSAVRLQVDPSNLFNTAAPSSVYQRDSRLGMQIGLGYNFR